MKTRLTVKYEDVFPPKKVAGGFIFKLILKGMQKIVLENSLKKRTSQAILGGSTDLLCPILVFLIVFRNQPATNMSLEIQNRLLSTPSGCCGVEGFDPWTLNFQYNYSIFAVVILLFFVHNYYKLFNYGVIVSNTVTVCCQPSTFHTYIIVWHPHPSPLLVGDDIFHMG